MLEQFHIGKVQAFIHAYDELAKLSLDHSFSLPQVPSVLTVEDYSSYSMHLRLLIMDGLLRSLSHNADYINNILNLCKQIYLLDKRRADSKEELYSGVTNLIFSRLELASESLPERTLQQIQANIPFLSHSVPENPEDEPQPHETRVNLHAKIKLYEKRVAAKREEITELLKEYCPNSQFLTAWKMHAREDRFKPYYPTWHLEKSVKPEVAKILQPIFEEYNELFDDPDLKSHFLKQAITREREIAEIRREEDREARERDAETGGLLSLLRGDDVYR